MGKKGRELVSDQIRRAIEESKVSRYEIAKQSGIDESALAKFFNGSRGLSMTALNRLGEFLDLKVSLGKKKTYRKKGG